MSKSAFIVVDMLFDFTNPSGCVYYPKSQQILPKISIALEIVREKGVLVAFLQQCYRKDKPDRNLLNMRSCCVEGSGGEKIDQNLDVREEDYLIKKRRFSGFYSTDLDLVLREHSIENVFIVGMKTNCCVRSTVNDAHDLNFNVFVLRDCVATDDDKVNEMHLDDIEKYFGKVINSDQLANYLG